MTEHPRHTPEQVLRGLSLPRRAGYAVAGLAGLAGAAMLTALWATEPAALPARTRLAFAALIAIGLAWAAFAAWALARRPLFAVDRLVAAALAVGFSTLSTAGTVAVALARGSTADVLVAAGVGLTLIVISTVMLARARTYRAVLLARRRELGGREMLPIGPLALAMRHRGGGRIAIAALIVGAALVAGLVLLLR
ncbi:hypothetical protein Rhe02_13690 [Rhizocola hellebori]|uniref:Uncharacterized protein n=1 Tax=Rhizocola hellebori TaxID=1392758 RepID=A0A8J3Q4G3_9ACTN|nr:hypothetical protein [Rhizocola hellebori]GIH03302.1 hypothetical protein Rhe02_13690 [Rhizocola hellebori]